MSRTLPADLLHTDEYRLDPFPAWERLRHDMPLLHDEVDDVWALTRYDDVAAIFREWETYSTSPYSNIFGPVIGRTMVELDGDEHVRLRRLGAAPFSGEPLRGYRPMVEEVARKLVESLSRRPRVDVYDDFASHLPVAVMAQILGLPGRDHELFASVAKRIMAGLEGVEPALSEGIAAHHRLGDYIQPLMEERRACPHADVISRIVTAEFEGDVLADDEVKTFVSLLINAGGDTTSHTLSALLFNVLREPGVLEEVTSDPSLWDAAFSETMRRDGPVVYEDRVTTRDVEWYGQQIPAGSTMRAFIASANTDEAVFRDPLRFDLHRTDLQMGREQRAGIHTDEIAGHLGFGLGRHFCIGWQLARLEITTGCRMLLEALDEPRVAEGTEPNFVVHFLVRTIDRLELESGPRS